jgi:monovalent cation:H+ antiporter-2, CPA2 family
MPHNIDLILTLTAGLAAALALGYGTQLLGLSPIVGYLLAGIVVGPSTPGFAANQAYADQFAEMGVVLLMFGVGLHFHVGELLAVRKIAIPGAIFQSFVATVLGALLGFALGWGWSGGIVFGLAISVASTVVLLRVLADNNELHTKAGHIAIGWLIVEDLLTVVVLVLMPAIFSGKAAAPGMIAVELLLALGKILIMVALVMLGGGRVIPWFLARIANTRSRELFTLAVLVIALGIAVGATKLFGVSMALGAFLGGLVVGQSEFSSRAASEALPMRDAFAVLFFVSVGMLFDPALVLSDPLLVVATLAIVILGKPLAALCIVLLLKYPLRTALIVAVALGQIGEFTFILATMGRELKVLPENATNALVVAALVSISVNPLVYQAIEWMERSINRSPRIARWLANRSKPDLPHESYDTGDAPSAVVVGYGPVGRTLVRLLQENGIEPAVVELNLNTVHRLRDEGFRAVYGDVHHKETLLEAGAASALTIILSSSYLETSDEVIRVIREVNPNILVFARATHLREVPSLRRAGAEVVFSGEGEVALTMTEFILRNMGATEEQIDRERDRVRRELFGTPLTVELLMPLPQMNQPASQEYGMRPVKQEPTQVAIDGHALPKAEPLPDGPSQPTPPQSS